MKNDHDSGAAGVAAEETSPLQLEPSVPTRRRCKGTKKNGTACTAWATEGGLCYFHANPDKAAELGRNGGRRRQHTFEQPTEPVAPPESAAEVRRMLAEVMADIRAGKMDPKLGTTLGYVGTALLRGGTMWPRMDRRLRCREWSLPPTPCTTHPARRRQLPSAMGQDHCLFEKHERLRRNERSLRPPLLGRAAGRLHS